MKSQKLSLGLFFLALFVMISVGFAEEPTMDTSSGSRETATLGGGCFWCVEAVYERIDGISSVISGYAGGTAKNPTYKEVLTGGTGHAEVVQVEYDPSVISYKEILTLFWTAHDPTTINQQGADIGPQYRSIILYNSDEQRQIAENLKNWLDASDRYISLVVTKIQAFDVFYLAEDYHQDYYEKNPDAGYCRFVIKPKLQKLGLDIQPIVNGSRSKSLKSPSDF